MKSFALFLTVTVLLVPCNCDETISASVGWTISLLCQKSPSRSTVDRVGADGSLVIVYSNGAIQPEFSSRLELRRQGRNAFELVVPNVQNADEGRYRCYDGDESKAAIFNVVISDFNKINNITTVQAAHPTITTPTSTPSEGQPIIATCQSNGGKPEPKVYWELRNVSSEESAVQIPTGESTSEMQADGTYTVTSTLTTDVTRAMALNVTQVFCVAQTSRFYQAEKFQFKSRVEPLAPVINSTNRVYNEGESVYLTCEASQALPPAKITWTLDDITLASREKIERREDNTYNTVQTLQTVASSDLRYRTLRCHVSHVTLKTQLTEEASILVRYKPILSSNQTRVTPNEGESVTLSYAISSYPKFSYLQWKRVRSNSVIDIDSATGRVGGIHPRMDIVKTPSFTSLTISNVKWNDADKYYVTVENEVGSVDSPQISVDVLHAPVCDPRMKTQYGAELNSPIRLLCDVRANPNNPEFHWTIPSGVQKVTVPELHPSQTAIRSSMSYVVKSSRDYGTVFCNAWNRAGQSKQSCKIQVRPTGPTERPEKCEVISVTSWALKLHCMPGFDGGYPVTFQLLAKYRTLEKRAKRSTMNFEVIASAANPYFNVALSQGRQYTVKVCSSNAKFPTQACSEEVQFSTPANSSFIREPEAGSTIERKEPLNDGMYIVFIAVGSVIFLLVLVACTWVVCVWGRRMRDRKADEENQKKRRQFCLEPYDISSVQNDLHQLDSQETFRKYYTRSGKRKDDVPISEADTFRQRGRQNSVPDLFTPPNNRKLSDIHELTENSLNESYEKQKNQPAGKRTPTRKVYQTNADGSGTLPMRAYMSDSNASTRDLPPVKSESDSRSRSTTQSTTSSDLQSQYASKNDLNSHHNHHHNSSDLMGTTSPDAQARQTKRMSPNAIRRHFQNIPPPPPAAPQPLQKYATQNLASETTYETPQDSYDNDALSCSTSNSSPQTGDNSPKSGAETDMTSSWDFLKPDKREANVFRPIPDECRDSPHYPQPQGDCNPPTFFHQQAQFVSKEILDDQFLSPDGCLRHDPLGKAKRKKSIPQMGITATNSPRRANSTVKDQIEFSPLTLPRNPPQPNSPHYNTIHATPKASPRRPKAPTRHDSLLSSSSSSHPPEQIYLEPYCGLQPASDLKKNDDYVSELRNFQNRMKRLAGPGGLAPLSVNHHIDTQRKTSAPYRQQPFELDVGRRYSDMPQFPPRSDMSQSVRFPNSEFQAEPQSCDDAIASIFKAWNDTPAKKPISVPK